MEEIINKIGLKKLITIIVALIVLLVIILVLNIKSNEPTLADGEHDSPDNEEYIAATKYKLQVINNLSDYYTIKYTVNKFFLYYSNIFENKSEENINSLYNMLAKDCIEKEEITKENIKTYFKNKTNFSVEIYKVYYATNYEGNTYYFVSGKTRDKDTHDSENFQLGVVINGSNNTYDVYTQAYLNNKLNIDVDNLEEGKETSLSFDYLIDNRVDNVFDTPTVSYSDYAKEMFETVRNLLLYDPEKAYELLNKGKDSEFYTKEELKKYVEENRSKIYLLTYGSYERKSEEGKMIYHCYDKNSDYVISFETNGIMNFTFSINEL